MRLYSQDVVIYGTVYVKAKSCADAQEKVRAFIKQADVELDKSSPDVSGLHFDCPGLPDVSLSPSVTVSDLTGKARLA